MSVKPKSKGSQFNRFAIRFFTVVFAVVVFWLLGFLVRDIKAISGPQLFEIEKKHVPPELYEQQKDLAEQVAELDNQIEHQTEVKTLIDDGSQNLEQTFNSLLELQKPGMQKQFAISETEQVNLNSILQLFLENQTKYQEVNKAIADLNAQKNSLNKEQQKVEQQLEEQRKPAVAEHQGLSAKHRLKLAFFQLVFLLPLLGIATILVFMKRTSVYFPLFLAFGGATLVKVGFVVHEYFPRQYIKYIWIGALLLVVARILIHFIRMIAFPKVQWLIRQYHEAYERFLCPVCEYPIQVGPRRFLYWTRRTVKKVAVPSEHGALEEPYTCPSCGTRLFEECSSCHKIRHARLPHCGNCGDEKTIG
jgi:predicted RNA-binding Zn-ribbon protein involved in translation (DUF1610 family)